MTRLIFDTNVFSELMKPRPDEAIESWLTSLSEDLYITTVTVAEVSYGLARLPNSQRALQLKNSFATLLSGSSKIAILSVDTNAALYAGQFRAVRQNAGGSFAMADMLIAGITAEARATLATRNTKDFDGLPIDLVNPWAL